MTIALQDVARVLGVEATLPSAAVTGWSIDSRTLAAGDLFFALRGPIHDGHEHLAAAFARGAVAAVTDRESVAAGPVLRTANTLGAMQQLATWARAQWGGTVVGITGSAGKTTTKDVIAQMLGTRIEVGKTVGNFNNHVGVPVSILRLPDQCRVAVLEFGMNHAGEIHELAKIGRPQVAVVTNVGYAHIENFNSIDGIAAAKRELVDALPGDGTAVLNADDERVAQMGASHPGDVITFGLSERADVRATAIVESENGVRFLAEGTEFRSPMPGRHGVLNVLAGLAVSRHFGIAPESLREAVSALEPGKMRMERLTHHGITIWNDCYNSNPDAARAMLDVLKGTPAQRRIAVLGEMLELGRWAETLHRGVGTYAAQTGVSVLVGIRGAAQFMVDAATVSGLGADAAFFFEEPEAAGEFVKGIAREGDAILFKGSRGTRVEKALERFLS